MFEKSSSVSLVNCVSCMFLVGGDVFEKSSSVSLVNCVSCMFFSGR